MGGSEAASEDETVLSMKSERLFSANVELASKRTFYSPLIVVNIAKIA